MGYALIQGSTSGTSQYLKDLFTDEAPAFVSQSPVMELTDSDGHKHEVLSDGTNFAADNPMVLTDTSGVPLTANIGTPSWDTALVQGSTSGTSQKLKDCLRNSSMAFACLKVFSSQMVTVISMKYCAWNQLRCHERG